MDSQQSLQQQIHLWSTKLSLPQNPESLISTENLLQNLANLKNITVADWKNTNADLFTNLTQEFSANETNEILQKYKSNVEEISLSSILMVSSWRSKSKRNIYFLKPNSSARNN